MDIEIVVGSVLNRYSEDSIPIWPLVSLPVWQHKVKTKYKYKEKIQTHRWWSPISSQQGKCGDSGEQVEKNSWQGGKELPTTKWSMINWMINFINQMLLYWLIGKRNDNGEELLAWLLGTPWNKTGRYSGPKKTNENIIKRRWKTPWQMINKMIVKSLIPVTRGA